MLISPAPTSSYGHPWPTDSVTSCHGQIHVHMQCASRRKRLAIFTAQPTVRRFATLAKCGLRPPRPPRFPQLLPRGSGRHFPPVGYFTRAVPHLRSLARARNQRERGKRVAQPTGSRTARAITALCAHLTARTTAAPAKPAGPRRGRPRLRFFAIHGRPASCRQIVSAANGRRWRTRKPRAAPAPRGAGPVYGAPQPETAWVPYPKQVLFKSIPPGGGQDFHVGKEDDKQDMICRPKKSCRPALLPIARPPPRLLICAVITGQPNRPATTPAQPTRRRRRRSSRHDP